MSQHSRRRQRQESGVRGRRQESESGVRGRRQRQEAGGRRQEAEAGRFLCVPTSQPGLLSSKLARAAGVRPYLGQPIKAFAAKPAHQN